ncbi:MAG: hypothetical protein H7066_22435 [Cytophagaceae bacterium]|nr:hypothetical protein [Gemmatimonadaceae bacterium]
MVEGPVVVAGGNLEVRGTIRGTAIAIAGDVNVLSGGTITGDAIAAFGDVTNAGTIGGTIKPFTGTFGASLRSMMRGDDTRPHPNRSPLNLALGWFTVMMLIGLGVLVFASPYLEGVVDVLGQSFWRSFLTGIVGELGVLPVILLVCVGLAITVIGALLIPFAIVAIVLAVAGLATLGFVAVARLTGDGLGGRGVARLSARGNSLRGVMVGLVVYMGLWLLAAVLINVPVAGTMLRVFALCVTFVAVTAGFGAALLSRGGTRRDAAVTVAPAPAADTGWQTPTPVAGVIAARRPKPKAEAGTGR